MHKCVFWEIEDILRKKQPVAKESEIRTNLVALSNFCYTETKKIYIYIFFKNKKYFLKNNRFLPGWIYNLLVLPF